MKRITALRKASSTKHKVSVHVLHLAPGTPSNANAFLNLARDIGLINRANRDAKNIVAHNLDLARQLIAGIDDITQDYLDKS